MNCPKCKKEIPYDSNLCCYCGNLVREKCQECGQMELIGKKVCETKLSEVYEAKKELIKDSKGFCNMRSGVYFSMFMFVIFFAMPFAFFLASTAGFSNITSLILGAILFTLSVYLFIAIDTKKNKKAEKLFSEKFPHYAEIIKKAESADA